MLTTTNTVTMSPEQWEAVIRGMRNPKNSWELSDSYISYVRNDENSPHSYPAQFFLGEKDRQLMLNPSKAGSDHAKFRRMMPVMVDIKAPLYWWKEFETYRTGVAPNPTDIELNSCSTMHKLTDKEFDLSDFSWEHLNPANLALLEGTIGVLNYYRGKYLQAQDSEEQKNAWWQIIQLLHSSYEQKRTMFINYEALSHMYHARKNHKLDEWRALCRWIESLPYSEIITGEVAE